MPAELLSSLTAKQLFHLLDARSVNKTPEPYKVFSDGMAVWVYKMAFGNGRLCWGYEDDRCGFLGGWCYKSVESAFAAADAWDGTGIPAGWKKDLQTQEYRHEYE